MAARRAKPSGRRHLTNHPAAAALERPHPRGVDERSCAGARQAEGARFGGGTGRAAVQGAAQTGPGQAGTGRARPGRAGLVCPTPAQVSKETLGPCVAKHTRSMLKRYIVSGPARVPS